MLGLGLGLQLPGGGLHSLSARFIIVINVTVINAVSLILCHTMFSG